MIEDTCFRESLSHTIRSAEEDERSFYLTNGLRRKCSESNPVYVARLVLTVKVETGGTLKC